MTSRARLDALRAEIAKKPTIPEQAICPGCGRVKVDYPGLEEVAVQRGISPERLHVVACYCHLVGKGKALLPHNLPHSGRHQTPANFETSDPNPGLEEAARFAAGEGPHILVLQGPTDSGKTHLLECIGRECLARGLTVRYEYVPELLRRVRASFRGDDAEDPLEVCEAASVLLLDELGLGNTTEWVQEQITSVVDERYRNGRRLAIGMNLGDVDIAQKLGFRLESRLLDDRTGAVLSLVLPPLGYRRAP